MVVFLDGRNVAHNELDRISVKESFLNEGQFDIIAAGMPETDNILLSFSTKEEAEAFVLKAQNALAQVEGAEFMDLRGDHESNSSV